MLVLYAGWMSVIGGKFHYTHNNYCSTYCRAYKLGTYEVAVEYAVLINFQ